MKKKLTPENRLRLIFWVGAAVCAALCLGLKRHISELFLVIVIWYAYWYITLKRKHELEKLREEEARQEAEWQAEQERLRREQEAGAEDVESPDDEENEDN